MSVAYQATINTGGCNFEFWVNDFRVDELSSDAPANYDLPLSPYIRSGENKLRLIMKPLSFSLTLDADSTAVLTVTEGTLEAGDYTKTRELTKLQSPAIKAEGDILPASYTLEGVILAKPDFPVITPDELAKIEVTLQEAHKLYEKIYSLFSARNDEALIDAMSHKIKHYGNALNTTSTEEIQRTKASFARLYKLKLEPLNLQGYRLKMYHDGRVCCLENEEGDQPVVFSNADKSVSTFYPVYFGKVKGDKEWKIVL